MKRFFDLTLIFLSLPVLIPVFIVVAVLVRVKLGDPVFFSQERPGKDAKPFKMFKFRSMTDERDGKGDLLPNTVRLTKFGNLLRSTSLDELPGLWNVLKGEMSLIGPRPLLMTYVPLYSPEQSRRHQMHPGITGWAQVNGRNAISWEDKFKYDAWYVDNHTLWLDIKIIWLTIKKVIERDGISAEGGVIMPRFTGSKTSNELIVIGASGFGKEVVWLAERAGYAVKGFLDDKPELAGRSFYSLPVLGKVSDWQDFCDLDFVVAVASPRIRKTIVSKMKNEGSPNFVTLIDPDASIVRESLQLGEGVIICAGTVCTADVRIDAFVIINKLCSIGHDVTVNSFSTLAPKAMIGGHVILGECSEVGANACVKQGVSVASGALVGMGSVVIKNLTENTVVVGNPSRLLKMLDPIP